MVLKKPPLPKVSLKPKRIRKRCQTPGCTKGAASPTDHCIRHGGGRRCHIEGCGKSAVRKTDYCIAHGGGKRCEMEGCSTAARGTNKYCAKHGGGSRCQMKGCSKFAVSPTYFCKAHFGGERCETEGCVLSARGGSKHCATHGGGKRCKMENCTTSAESPTDYCVMHGGGKLCKAPNCTNASVRPTDFCFTHRGGRRCTVEGCDRPITRGATKFCAPHARQQICEAEGCEDLVCGTSTRCEEHGGVKTVRRRFAPLKAASAPRRKTRSRGKTSQEDSSESEWEDEQAQTNASENKQLQPARRAKLGKQKGSFRDDNKTSDSDGNEQTNPVSIPTSDSNSDLDHSEDSSFKGEAVAMKDSSSRQPQRVTRSKRRAQTSNKDSDKENAPSGASPNDKESDLAGIRDTDDKRKLPAEAPSKTSHNDKKRVRKSTRASRKDSKDSNSKRGNASELSDKVTQKVPKQRDSKRKKATSAHSDSSALASSTSDRMNQVDPTNRDAVPSSGESDPGADFGQFDNSSYNDPSDRDSLTNSKRPRSPPRNLGDLQKQARTAPRLKSKTDTEPLPQKRQKMAHQGSLLEKAATGQSETLKTLDQTVPDSEPERNDLRHQLPHKKDTDPWSTLIPIQTTKHVSPEKALPAAQSGHSGGLDSLGPNLDVEQSLPSDRAELSETDSLVPLPDGSDSDANGEAGSALSDRNNSDESSEEDPTESIELQRRLRLLASQMEDQEELSDEELDSFSFMGARRFGGKETIQDAFDSGEDSVEELDIKRQLTTEMRLKAMKDSNRKHKSKKPHCQAQGCNKHASTGSAYCRKHRDKRDLYSEDEKLKWPKRKKVPCKSQDCTRSAQRETGYCKQHSQGTTSEVKSEELHESKVLIPAEAGHRIPQKSSIKREGKSNSKKSKKHKAKCNIDGCRRSSRKGTPYCKKHMVAANVEDLTSLHVPAS